MARRYRNTKIVNYNENSGQNTGKYYATTIYDVVPEKDDDMYFEERKPKNIYVYYLNKKVKKKMLNQLI